MRFIVDNQLPTALARWLSARGVGDAVHVLDIAFASSRLRARARRIRGWVYNHGSNGNHALSSQRLCASAGNRPPPQLRASA
jgi:hypothetical protein